MVNRCSVGVCKIGFSVLVSGAFDKGLVIVVLIENVFLVHVQRNPVNKDTS